MSLNDRRCVTVATTHLGELKDLAARTAGVVNGSLQFDTETLTPTYRFEKDRPGRSYGLAIARRLGLPQTVLEQAEALQPAEARNLDAVLAEAERREATLREREDEAELQAARLTRDLGAVERMRDELERRDREVGERERELEREGRVKARQFLLDARGRVEEALGVARAAVSEATAKQARRLVEEGVSEEAAALEKLENVARAKGWRVKGAGDESAGRGGQEQDAKLDSPAAPARGGEAHPDRPAGGFAVETAASEIDLRGMTGDEAESALTLAIDDAVAADLPWLRIIHGKGTGALRARVSQVLRGDRRVTEFRLAPPEQGGSGVTTVEFGRSR
jgi:DNA mismatch repair protein MutS2